MLDELATLIPKRVWLRKLDEKGGAIAFEGVAGTIDDVSAFLTALKGAVYFSSPELQKTTSKGEGKLKLVEFSVTAGVDYTAGARVAATAASTAAPGAPGKP